MERPGLTLNLCYKRGFILYPYGTTCSKHKPFSFQPLPAADSEAQVLAQWNAVYDAYNKELKSMFEKQARVERFDMIQTFHACKQEEGKPVRPYGLKIKGYVEQLKCLGYVLPQDLSVGLIMASLYKKGLPKKAATPQVMVIQGGRIQKANKKSQNAKGNGKGIGKGKDKSYIPKLKTPKPSAKEHPTKDDTCHHCKEVGHWKRNCPVYLAELIKKKKQVYDTGCGTHICSTKQGLKGARKLKQRALYLYIGNGVRAQVEAIGSYDLVLPNGLIMEFQFQRMMFFILMLFLVMVLMWSSLDFNKKFYNSLGRAPNRCSSSIGKTQGVVIVQSRNRLERLDHGRMTRKPFPHHIKRATDLLGIIHTDVCGPLRHVSRQGSISIDRGLIQAILISLPP
ncbi:zinc finger, CCHC-type containing protein [Tanacetum coccineum]|uniref:Zinc finger, CCHC-type containing protein n=1 Tax=Tanacetum coccineum TaxID=301880 RepID=A0ABQ4YKN8_9ASTR